MAAMGIGVRLRARAGGLRPMGLVFGMSAPAQSPVSVLCEWAWTKVNLKQLQEEGNPALVNPAIVAFRHALRKKKKLDADYRDHHADLMELDDVRARLLKLLADHHRWT